MQFDNYECPHCGYLVDKSIYEYGIKVNPEARCLCNYHMKEYNFVPMNTASPFLKGMWIKYPEGFELVINGVTVKFTPLDGRLP